MTHPPAVFASAVADDPFSIFSGSPGQLLLLLLLIPAAVVVFWFGSRQFRKDRRASDLRPKGRLLRDESATRPAKWRAEVERLQMRPPTPIARAKRGAVKLQGVIVGANGNLGGSPGRECVYRNRAGARAESAVAAELIVIADETGRCGIEGLEQAYLVAEPDRHGVHVESVSLNLGDRIEAIGLFDPEELPEHPDATEIVYGTLGARGHLDVRRIERPSDESGEPKANPASTCAPSESDSPASSSPPQEPS